MPTYYYKGFNFNTELKYYRVKRSNTPKFIEENGILNICLPSIMSFCEPTRKLEEVIINYNGARYRRKSVEPVLLRIYFIEELEELVREENDYSLTILLPANYKLSKLTSLISGKLFEYIDGSISNMYEVNELINSDKELIGSSLPLSYKQTVCRYTTDFTVMLDGIQTFFEEYLKPYGFYFFSEHTSGDTENIDTCYFSFGDYSNQFTRFWPQYNNEITEYKIPLRLKLIIASVSKFERLLAEIRSLKFLTNIVRVNNIQDKIGIKWTIPIKWDPTVSTNDPLDVRSDDAVSYEIKLNAEIIIYSIRDEQYHPILEIIKNIKNVKLST